MRSHRILMIGLEFSILTGFGFAQGTNLGTIRGTVTDVQGALVPGATVRVTDLETNLSIERPTDSEGNYAAPNLKPGNYKVTVSMPGFNNVEIVDLVLRGSDTVRADAKLTVSKVNEKITVTTEAPLINAETPTVSGTLNSQQILELPRDSRDIYDFLFLNPNITQAEDTFKFIGSQSYGASFSIDGQRSNGGIFGQPTGSQPSLEAIGELTVLSNSFTAEYAGIANIRVVTKRGGKNYHGSLFYNNKNSALAAWRLDDKIAQQNFLPVPGVPTFPTPYFNLNETGGSFGGPVPRSKKTFFLVSYERRWFASPATATSTSVPSQRILNGDFSQITDSRKPVVPAGVVLTPEEIATNTKTVGGTSRFVTIPQRLLNPAVGSLIKNYFPVSSLDAPINSSNGRLQNFFQNIPSHTKRDLGTLRIDHDFSNKNRVYFVYDVSDQIGSSSPVGSPYPALGLLQSNRHNHTISASHTHLLSPTLINEARGGFNFQNLYRHGNQTVRQFLSNIGFDQSDIDAWGAVIGRSALDLFGQPQITFGPYSRFPNGGRSVDRRLDQHLITFGDTLTWVAGRHSIKAGADFVRNSAQDGFVQNRGQARGAITYTGNDLNPLTRFLLGTPPNTVNFVQQLRGILDVANWEHGYFFQDDFKVRPRLTLNLGLRYELITPFVDKNDLMVNFDPAFVDPTTGRHGRFVVPTQAVLQQIDPRMVAYGAVTAADAGVGRGLVKTDKDNLAPRIGLAWRVKDKLVLRGGWGLFYPTSAAQGIRDAMESSPFNQGRTKRNTTPPLSGWPGFSHGFSPLTGGALTTIGSQPSANAIPFDLQEPRVQQYNATIERELSPTIVLRASYLGTRMSGLIAGVDLNEIRASDKPFGTTTGDGVTPCDPLNAGNCDLSPSDIGRRAFPELGSFLASYGNVGDGTSHALQFEVNRRYSRGLTFNASYTLLSQTSSGLDTANASLGGTLYNQFNPGNDFARDAYISRHRFVAYGIYDLPFGRDRRFGSSLPRWADQAFGSWQLSTNIFIKSGAGFTPFWECDNCGPVFPGNIGSEFVDAIGGFGGTSFRPLVVGNAYQGVSGDRIFSASAFAPPTVGADMFDNTQVAKRNFLTGPGTWGVNLGVHKVIKFSERTNLNIGATFDNVFNHPLRSPTSGDTAMELTRLGSFSVAVDPATGKLLPIDPANVNRNPDFGRLKSSFTQEGIDNRRSIRLSLRLTF